MITQGKISTIINGTIVGNKTELYGREMSIIILSIVVGFLPFDIFDSSQFTFFDISTLIFWPTITVSGYLDEAASLKSRVGRRIKVGSITQIFERQFPSAGIPASEMRATTH